MKMFTKAALAATALVGAVPALAASPIQIYAGYSDNEFDSSIIRFVVSAPITNGLLTGVGTSGTGFGLTGSLTLGDLAVGTYDCTFSDSQCTGFGVNAATFASEGAPFAYDYDDFFSGSVTYTFTADGIGPYVFSPESNASHGFLAFLGNDANGNELDQEVGFTLVAPGGVPEPASWALMIAGFGLTGAAMRRRVALTA